MIYKKIRYSYLSGPVKSAKEVLRQTKGNCRFAVQYFYLKRFKKFLKPQDILWPKIYYKTGKFVVRNSIVNPKQLRVGDIIFARRKKGILGKFKETRKGTYHLHTAVVERAGNNLKIFHSAFCAKGSRVWSWNLFLKNYEPISVKRLIL